MAGLPLHLSFHEVDIAGGSEKRKDSPAVKHPVSDRWRENQGFLAPSLGSFRDLDDHDIGWGKPHEEL